MSGYSWNCQVPRAPLHVPGVISHVMMSGTMSVGITPPYIAPTGSCASPPPSSRLGGILGHQVYAGCCQPLLGEGPSRRCSAHPSLRAWTPTPAALEVHVPVSSPKTSAFPSFGPGRRSTLYRTATSVRRAFRGCSHSLMFRPAGLLATQIAPTATAYTVWQP